MVRWKLGTQAAVSTMVIRHFIHKSQIFYPIKLDIPLKNTYYSHIQCHAIHTVQFVHEEDKVE